MNKLLEDEDSADEEFWGQDAFAEESGDEEYSSESEEADVFDKDFDDDESSSDSEEVVVAKERRKPALKAPERKAPPAPRAAATATKERAKKPPRGLDGMSVFSPDGLEWSDGGGARVDNDGGLRKSSRASVKQILSESERSREERRSKAPPKRTAPAEPARPLTQAEILAEAAVTEVWNLRDLEYLLNLEEATKKKAERVKTTFTGPTLRVRSVGDKTTIEPRYGASLPEPLGMKAPTPPMPERCVVTGDRARYRDPLTGLAYKDVAAFKELRRRHAAATAAAKKDAVVGVVEVQAGVAAAPAPAKAPAKASAAVAETSQFAVKTFSSGSPVDSPSGGSGGKAKKRKLASLNEISKP